MMIDHLKYERRKHIIQSLQFYVYIVIFKFERIVWDFSMDSFASYIICIFNSKDCQCFHIIIVAKFALI